MFNFIDVISQKQSIFYIIAKVLILAVICGILLGTVKKYIGINNYGIEMVFSMLLMFISMYIADYIYYKLITEPRFERKVNSIMNIHDTIKKMYDLDPNGEYDIYRITAKYKRDNFIFTFDQYGKSSEELMNFWKSPSLHNVSDNYEFLKCELYQKRGEKNGQDESSAI